MNTRQTLLVSILLASSPSMALAANQKENRPTIYDAIKKGVYEGRSYSSLESELTQRGLLSEDDDSARRFYEALKKNGLPSRHSRDSDWSSLDGAIPEVEPNDDPENATALPLGETGQGSLGSEGDVDVWTFTVPERLGIIVDLRATDSRDVDTRLALVNQDGDFLDEDRGDGPGSDDRIVTVLPAGIYFLVVQSALPGGGGEYVLRLRADDRIRPLGPRERREEALETVDFFTFEVPDRADVRTSIHGSQTGLDTFLRVSDENGRVLAEDDDGAAQTDSRTELFLPAGLYFITVDSFEGDGFGPYALSLDTSPAPVPTSFEQEPNDAFETQDRTACCDRKGGVIDRAFDLDHFNLRLDEPTLLVLTVDTPNSGLDPVVTLFHADGEPMASDDDSGREALDSRLEVIVDRGDYVVQVRDFHTFVGSYELMVTCSPLIQPSSTEIEPNQLFDDATPLSLSRSLHGDFHLPFDVDVYVIEVLNPIELDLRVDTPKSNVDPVLAVLDEEGNTLYENDDRDEEFGEFLDPALRGIFLAPGRYFISVREFDDGVGSYQIVAEAVFLHHAPAESGEVSTFSIKARNQDLLFILIGTREAVIPTPFGNVLIDPATFVFQDIVPECGIYTFDVVIPENMEGLFFLTQALVGNVDWGGARFSERLRVDID